MTTEISKRVSVEPANRHKDWAMVVINLGSATIVSIVFRDG